MTARRRPQTEHEAGFSLIEMLLATALMVTILAALATVTAQWLPNWNRGFSQVQISERLSIGLERLIADLAAAEMVSANKVTMAPYFLGAELSVTLVRTAIGPNSRPGLEVIRLFETADNQGVALVRERAPFAPYDFSMPLRLADPVVLIRAPYRVSFSYAGLNNVWQPTWRDAPELPRMVRVSVRDGRTGQTLAVSSAALVHVNAPAACARADDPRQCLVAQAQFSGRTVGNRP